MLSALVSTAHWAAWARAAETVRQDGLFRDFVALTVAAKGDPNVLTQLRTTRSPQFEYFAVRTRFLDDFLTGSLSDARREQAVLLAAGMDSRAFRLDVPPGSTIYELDLPDLFAEKEPMLHRLGEPARCARVVLPVDLTGNWQQPLLEAGFDPRRPSVWIVEGLFYYLDQQQVDLLLSQISAVAAAGSALGIEHINPEMINAPERREWMATFEAQGAPWRSAVAEPASWLDAAGWSATVREAGQLPYAEGRDIDYESGSVPGTPRAWLISAERRENG